MSKHLETEKNQKHGKFLLASLFENLTSVEFSK
jgi:hypothetical protein